MDGAGGEAAVLGPGGGAPALLERLQRREQERLQGAERRRQEKAGATVEEEKRDFLAAFSPEREALERLLQDGPPEEEGAEAGLQAAAERLQALQKLLNDSVRFLPAYDVKQAQEALQRLQAALGERRERLRPKKRFAFKARERMEPLPAAASAPPAAAPTPPPAPPQEPDYSCGFRGLQAQLLELSGEELRGRDVQLSQLRGCRVRLLGSPGTLHLRGLQGCTVLCGPVSSSIFVDECSGSELAFACQQLRMHRSLDTRIYLQVTSRAIIEDCRGLAFAPLTWGYPGMEEDFRRAGLDPARNHWSQVDDFNWLARDAASPNWSILPEEQRRTQWD